MLIELSIARIITPIRVATPDLPRRVEQCAAFARR
jgi:hypothetical protein